MEVLNKKYITVLNENIKQKSKNNAMRNFQKAIFLLLFIAGLKPIIIGQTISPYLQAPTPNSMWVTWYTTSGTESKVLWGTSPASLTQTTTGTVDSLSAQYILHHVQLTGLLPNTTYYYKTVTGTQESAVTRFVAAPALGTNTGRMHYIVYGDTQDPVAIARVAPKIEEKCRLRFGNNWEDSVRFVIKLGDNVDNGGTIDQWKDLHMGSVQYVSGRIPVMTVPGNHEYYNNATLSNYFAHTKYENIEYGNVTRLDGEHYYSWQYGNMLFIMFNSNESWTRQTDWVRNVVTYSNTDNSLDWVFAASHHPNFQERSPGDASPYVINNIVPELSKSRKMAAEYSGHSHLYSRGAPKDSAFHQIVNGGSSWIERWGTSDQTDHADVQKTIDHYLFQIVTMDLGQKKMTTETYSNGTNTYVMDNILIDTYSKDLNASAPSKPTITVPASIILPYTFQAGAYNGTIAYNSTEFQVVDSAGSFASPTVRMKRDFENVYLASNPNAYSPIDQNAGVDIFKYTAPLNALPGGKNKIRVRFRDKNMKWSAWSDSATFIVTNGAPAASQVPIVYYPFNNNTNDESGFNRHAVNTGITFQVDSVRNQNVGVFNNNAFADIATGSSSAVGMPTKNMTASCWVKVNTTDTWAGFFGNLEDDGSIENGWVLGSLANKFSFALRTVNGAVLTYLSDNATFNTGTWYHVAGSYDGVTMKLYVNGQLKATSVAQNGNIVYPVSGWFTIGRYKDSNEDFRHDGSLDEVKLWERTLTAQEVLNQYNNTNPIAQPVAGFAANQTTITVDQSVTFTNASSNATSYSWGFSGGTPATSTNVNPVVVYKTAGQYNVTLTATGPGGSNTQTKTQYIKVNPINGGVPPPAGTIVYYPFANNFNDAGGNNYHATVTGTSVYSTRGTSVFADFDNNLYGDIRTGINAVAIQPISAITVMGWVRVDAADAWGGFVGCIQDNGSTENGWVLGTRNNKFSFALKSIKQNTPLTYLVDTATFTLGQWYHVAATYDGTTMKLYVNGVLKATSVAQFGNIQYASSHWFTLGRYKDENEDTKHDGGLDEVYVINRALSLTEIQTVMNNSAAAVMSTAPVASTTAPVASTNNTEIDESNNLSVYPIPAEKELKLSVNSSEEKLEYQIFDASGRILKKGTVIANQTTTISVADLTPGSYVIKVVGKATKLSKSFLKN